mgnify:FL=1
MSEPVKPPGRALVPKPVGEILDGDAAALEALRQNPVAAYLASLDSVESRRSMGSKLDRLTGKPGLRGYPGARAAEVAWHRLSDVELSVLRTRLATTTAPATVNATLTALRGGRRFARKRKLLTHDQLADRLGSLKTVKGSRVLRGRMLSVEEQRALFDACGEGPIRARNAALLAIAMMGLRRAEIAVLDLAAYDPTTSNLTFVGKRNKQRIVPLAPGAVRAIEAWLDVRGRVVAGPLLTRVSQTGVVGYGGLSKQTVYDTLGDIARRAKVTKVTPHDFRRTLISTVLDQGDASAAQQIAGHENIATTLRYDRRGEKATKAAVAKIDVPYEKKP